jgi:hypothetical protein
VTCLVMHSGSNILRRKLTDIMLVYDILNNFIDFHELLYEIGFHIPCRNSKTDLFVILNFNTNSGNNTFFFIDQ